MDQIVGKAKRAVSDSARKVASGPARPVATSPYTNIYHCCVHRTGSQRLRALLADPIIYRRSGLRTYHYRSHMPEKHDPRKVNERALLTFAFSSVYVVAVGVPWEFSPLTRLFPEAYEFTGLVAFTVFANALNGLALPQRYELLGALRESAVSSVEVFSNARKAASAAAAQLLGPFVVPAGDVVLGVARLLGYRSKLADVYASPPTNDGTVG